MFTPVSGICNRTEWGCSRARRSAGTSSAEFRRNAVRRIFALVKGTLSTIVLNIVAIAMIILVIRSKLKGRERATGELGDLARALSLAEQPSRVADSMAAADRARLQASATGRVGAELLEKLPGVQHTLFVGIVDGVRVTLSVGAERRGQSGQQRLMEFNAQPSSSWGVGLAIGREHGMDHVLQPGRQAQDLATGDDDFSRDVFVRATSPERVSASLRDPELRRSIRGLLVEQPRSWIDDHGVHVQMAGSAPPVEVARTLVQSMVGLVRALDVMLAAS